MRKPRGGGYQNEPRPTAADGKGGAAEAAAEAAERACEKIPRHPFASLSLGTQSNIPPKGHTVRGPSVCACVCGRAVRALLRPP